MKAHLADGIAHLGLIASLLLFASSHTTEGILALLVCGIFHLAAQGFRAERDRRIAPPVPGVHHGKFTSRS